MLGPAGPGAPSRRTDRPTTPWRDGPIVAAPLLCPHARGQRTVARLSRPHARASALSRPSCVRMLGSAGPGAGGTRARPTLGSAIPWPHLPDARGRRLPIPGQTPARDWPRPRPPRSRACACARDLRANGNLHGVRTLAIPSRGPKGGVRRGVRNQGSREQAGAMEWRRPSRTTAQGQPGWLAQAMPSLRSSLAHRPELVQY